MTTIKVHAERKEVERILSAAGIRFEPEQLKVEIWQDGDMESPREWNNLTKMFCFHRNYNIGDNHSYDFADFDGWDEFREQLEEDYDIATIKPVYMYDHSGITISTSPFSCGWDSGQVGWVFITKDDAEKELKGGVMEAEGVLEAEFATYRDYVEGNAFGFTISNDDGLLDSCGGFLGNDEMVIKDMLDHVYIDGHSKERVKELFSEAWKDRYN